MILDILRRFAVYRLNANIIGTLPIFFAGNLVALTIYFLEISAHTMPLMLGVIAGDRKSVV